MAEKSTKAIFNFIISYAEFGIALIYFNNFLNKKNLSKLCIFLTGLAFSVVLTAVNTMSITIANTICDFILLLIVATVLYKDRIAIKLALAPIFVALSAASELSIMFLGLFASQTPMHEFLSNSKSYIIGGMLSKALLFIIVIIVIRKFPNKCYHSQSSNAVILSSYPIFSLFAVYVIMNYSNRLNVNLVETILITFFLISILLSGVIAFFVFDSSLLNNELKNKLTLSERIQQMNETILREQQRNIEVNKRYIHDFKYQLTQLAELYEKGHEKSAAIYQDNLIKRLGTQTMISFFNVNNPIISNTFERIRQSCQLYDTKFLVDIRYNQLGFIELIDASTLFDNIMDNALLACQESNGDRWIKVLIKAKSRFLLLSVSNSKDNAVVSENGFYLSTRRNYKEKGMGIENIKAIAEKYGGDILIDSCDNEFFITVRLQIPTELQM